MSTAFVLGTSGNVNYGSRRSFAVPQMPHGRRALALKMCGGRATGVSRRELLLGAALLAAKPPPALGAKYDDYAADYDTLDGANAVLPRALGLTQLRAEVVRQASGRVLEVGVGTGANLALYSDVAKSVVGLDSSAAMLRVAESNIGSTQTGTTRVPVELVMGDATALPFCEEEFDTVVDTFSLCVIEEPLEALREMRRVLKRNRTARVLLLEHTLSDFGPLAAFQNSTAKPVAAMSKGCMWNQNLAKLAREAGLVITEKRQGLAGTITALSLRRTDAMH